jgi:DNA polymerase-3 subunit epsilon
VTEIHGLTNEKLSQAPPIQFVISSFLSWIGDSPLVAHNARYDMRMLLLELQRLELEEKLNNRKVFCTMQQYRKQFPQRKYGLNDLVSHFGLSIDYKTNHTALADAETLSKIFMELLKLS